MAACNICSGTEFEDFAGRPGERCVQCKSLARHRVALEVYRRRGLLKVQPKRILHFAPESILHAKILPTAGVGYLCADSRPEVYESLKCLKVVLPEGLTIFPDGYFDFIIHNHVLEHIPGSFKDHLLGFVRVLNRAGHLIFSVPGPDMKIDTIEGGEHLATDEERLKRFGQIDHVKRFGRDLVSFLEGLPGGKFSRDDLTDEDRSRIAARPASNRFMIWQKAA